MKPFFIFIFITVLVFLPAFSKGLIVFPGNFLLAWYEPWKSDTSANGILTVSHKPIADDVFRQIYPYKELSTALLKQGKLPLWNPYNGSGMPLLATLHSGLLSPFNFVFFLLAPLKAWNAYIILQFPLLGFLVYLYIRKIGLSTPAGIASGTIAMLSGWTIARSVLGEFLYVVVFLPLLLYITEQYLKNHTSKVVYLISPSAAGLVLSGHPHMMLYVIFLFFSYSYCRFCVYRSTSKFVLNLFFLWGLFFLGIGIGSFQLIPALELYKVANVSQLSSAFIVKQFLMPIGHIISLVIPNYFGNQSTYNYWGHADYIETVLGLGTIACFLAYIGCRSKKFFTVDVRGFFLTVLFLSLILSTDWLGARQFFRIPIPILSTGVPTRIYVLTIFSIIVLAGYGFDAVFDKHVIYKQIHRSVAFYTALIGFVVFITVLIYMLKVPCPAGTIRYCRQVSLRNTLLEGGVFISFLFIFFLQSKFSKKGHQFFGYMTLGIMIATGVYNAYKFLPFSRPEAVLPQNAVLSALAEKTKDGRSFGFGSATIATDFATHFRYYDPQYYDPLYIRFYGELISYGNTGSLEGSLKRSDVEITRDIALPPELEKRRTRLLNLLSVKYFLYKKSEYQIKGGQVIWEDPTWYIVQNSSALPFIYTVSDFEVTASREQAIKKIFQPDFEPKSTVILDRLPMMTPQSVRQMDSLDAIDVQQQEPGLLALRTTTKGQRVLVVTENNYPGWKAFIDDRQAPVYTANGVFRAIALPGGSHTVRFVYDPKSLRLGFLFSGISFVVLIIIFLVRTISPYDNRKQ